MPAPVVSGPTSPSRLAANPHQPEADPPALDFVSLRRAGLRHLERLAGPDWTDFNTHDPGITVLEQFCYALTDLAYRSAHPLPDLLVQGDADPLASLHTPAQILPCGPVTLTDLRKLVIDVPGVHNAWVEVVDEVVAQVDVDRDELRLAPQAAAGGAAAVPGPNVSDLRLRGLLRVHIEKPDPSVFPPRGDIVAEAGQRLHRWRGLGQDFAEIKLLAQQSIRLVARLEIDGQGDAITLLSQVYQCIARYLSPPVPVYSLQQMLARGLRVDEVFEGPLLTQGFIPTDELARVERRSALRISDLIHAIMAVPGVLAVKALHFLDGEGDSRQASKDWVRRVDADKTPWFDQAGSTIHLEKNGLRVDDAIKDTAIDAYRRAMRAARPAPAGSAPQDLRPAPGRSRQVARQPSIQAQFPAVYGIGPAGLPSTATPERQALARQLQGYLLIPDQLLANQFAQLAAAPRLLSFHDESDDSYFAQPVADPDGSLGLDALYRWAPAERSRYLQQITEDASQADEAAGARRRNRFLDHLLARYGEQFHDYALMQAAADTTPDGRSRDAQAASDKRAFLRDLGRIGQERGTAFNALQPAGDDNLSGLALALQRRLGARGADERFHLVEHILLRPLPGDAFQHGPLLRAARSRDPYSLQITLVFPDGPARYRQRAFVEQTVRELTPAHLSAHLLWLGAEAMQTFEAAWDDWLRQWRAHRRAALGL